MKILLFKIGTVWTNLTTLSNDVGMNKKNVTHMCIYVDEH